MEEPRVPRRARLRRAIRLTSPKVWRSLLHGVSDPVNDPHWEFVEKFGTQRYLEDPEPWLAPGAVSLLKDRVRPGLDVLEWGSGSSTLWFISQGCRIRSYETDARWVKQLRGQARGAADIRHVELDEGYTRPPLDAAEIVLIDGRRRRDCALYAAEHANSGALVVFDDSHREEYYDGVQALAQRSHGQWHFPGLNAVMTPKLTSVFQLA